MNNEELGQSIHIKKLCTRGQVVFWLVDGSLVRQEIDKDFTNFGQHYRFPFIPEYECWLDREAVPNERNFFINHLLIEWRLQRRGYSYPEALDRADDKERIERNKAGYIKKFKNKDGNLNSKQAHIRLLKKIGLLSIWLVNGRLVRDFYNIDFTEGGHDLVYSFIPKNEIWIDNDVLINERPAIIFHELYEYQLMVQGWPYVKAHNFTLQKEWEIRHNKKATALEMEKLGWN